MAVGSTTTTIGRGVRAVVITGGAVGGGPRSSRFTFRLAITFAGIRFTIINAIRVRVITADTMIDATIDYGHCALMRLLACKESTRRTIAR
jgi:hypothetical protein